MDYETLLGQAEALKEAGETDTDLSERFRLAANDHYGRESREADFIAALRLAKAIEPSKKSNWQTELITLCSGQFPYREDAESFSLDHYAAGHTDLFRDGELVHRMYGIAVGITPHVTKSYTQGKRVIELIPTSSKGKWRRAVRLNEHLQSQLPNSEGLLIYGFVREEVNWQFTNHFVFPFGQIYVSRETGQDVAQEGRIIQPDADILERCILAFEEDIGIEIGRIMVNPRQVGTVRDGGSRYRK